MTKPKNRGGRPAKWSTDVAFALGLALQGRYTRPRLKLRKAGIGKSTLIRWFRLGEAGDKRFAPLVAQMKAIRQNWSLWL